MVVTIQEALEAEGATPDDLAVILGRLGTDGYTGDKAAGSVFLLLKVDYEETLNAYQCNLIRAAQLARGGGAGTLLGCMLWQGRCILSMKLARGLAACAANRRPTSQPAADALLLYCLAGGHSTHERSTLAQAGVARHAASGHSCTGQTWMA